MNEALRLDQIPNKVMKAFMPDISGHLEQIFNDSLFIGNYKVYFEESIIVILYNQRDTRDFINPKSSRPINLLNIVGKIIEAVLVVRISYMASLHNLLPKTHFGDQRRLCVEIAIHYLLEKIYTS